MELIRGTAENIRTATEIETNVSGAGNHGHHTTVNTTTTHVLQCTVHNKPVLLKMPTPPFINNGDEVAVAGVVKNGILHGYAYRNITSGATGNGGMWAGMVGGVVAAGIGIAAISFFASKAANLLQPDSLFSLIPYGIGGMFILVGALSFRKGFMMKKASEMLYGPSQGGR